LFAPFAQNEYVRLAKADSDDEYELDEIVSTTNTSSTLQQTRTGQQRTKAADEARRQAAEQAEFSMPIDELDLALQELELPGDV
jgi:hypothetical protein